MDKVKIFLLDDHKIVRDGLKQLLTIDPIFEVSGEEGHPSRFLKQLPLIDAHIVILDISLPDISGMVVLREIRSRRPEIKVVMLSMHDSPEYLVDCLRSGAGAYLQKDIDAAEFIKAIKEVHQKGVYHPSTLKFQMTEESDKSLARDLLPEADLTPKEKEVLLLIAQGLSSREIAEKQGLSTRTIEAHRLNIMKKLQTSNMAQTIALASRLKLI